MRWGAQVVGAALLLVAGSGVTTAVHRFPVAADAPALAATPPTAPTRTGTPAAVMPDSAALLPAPRSGSSAPPVATAPPAVRALSGLRVPDLLVRVRHPLSPRQLAALNRVRGVTALAVLDTGSVSVAGKNAKVVGVDPSQFRAFTPKETAQSDPLWQAVARGDLAPTYGLAKTGRLPLGGSVPVPGATPATQRIGAVAAFGLPDVDLVVDHSRARDLGATASTGLLLAAPGRSVEGLRASVRAVVGAADISVLRPQTVSATASKPRTYRELYIQSARYCPGMRWQLLAAIGQVESGHGRNPSPSSAGALGPMQFLPSTWATYGVDGDHDGTADIHSPFDAVPAAALYLCRFGGGRTGSDLYSAVYAYNHLDSYVQTVLSLADRYQ